MRYPIHLIQMRPSADPTIVLLEATDGRALARVGVSGKITERRYIQAAVARRLREDDEVVISSDTVTVTSSTDEFTIPFVSGATYPDLDAALATLRPRGTESLMLSVGLLDSLLLVTKAVACTRLSVQLSGPGNALVLRGQLDSDVDSPVRELLLALMPMSAEPSS